ncbi:MAG: Asp-tRNA(Asn)/Glu-tRNA(Gln) amidotransferase subunit GatB [Actinomycetia bacterium]|nr:Asp-tRNA(Asn)/Glu-tRNA(Gln) amidotransferase subunit GatB [Actinomycetes bacterium]
MKSLAEVLQSWEAVIGLEVHAELTCLKTKMFCSCAIEYGASPNTHVCPVCLGLPGALPVPNRAAIEGIVMAGLACGCEIMRDSMFYRKNYFYPDMSKNFQTTQGPIAFCMQGGLDLELVGKAAEERWDLAGTEPLDVGVAQGYRTHIGITRIHMEEDAGKMVHVGGSDGRITGAAYSLIDYNRCGTPLIELVTEPDMRSPEEARAFLQKLRQIYLTLGISDVSMEEGSLRCDGNVSLRRRGVSELGVKTELKNMNSFKNLHDGLAYEICRQAEVLEEGGSVRQETRHWEPAQKRTFTLRVKETADDYRLFPEPDLAPYHLSDEFVAGVAARLPELPDEKKTRYLEEYGLPWPDAVTLSSDPALSRFLDAALMDEGGAAAVKLARPLANLLLNEVSAWLASPQAPQSLALAAFSPQSLAELAELACAGTLSSKQVKEVFAQMAESGTSPKQIVKEQGLRQVSDVDAIQQVVAEVLAANPEKVDEYRAGKTGLLGFFVGQAMKAMGGQGNPKLINQLLEDALKG